MYRFRRTVAPLATAVLATLALGACSSDSPSTSPTVAPSSGAPAPGETLPAGSDTPAASDTSASGSPLPPADTSGGFCNVRVTGDVSAEWTSGGGMSSIGYGPWVPTQPGVAMPIPMDETFFIINCVGDDANYVGFGPATDVAIPMQPGSYVIGAGDNAFGASESGQMTVLITFAGSETNWGPVEDGQFVITEFDENHVAGTFSVTVTDVLAELTGSPSEGTATITGEFDLANPNL